jgi:hypothetical protein
LTISWFELRCSQTVASRSFSRQLTISQTTSTDHRVRIIYNVSMSDDTGTSQRKLKSYEATRRKGSRCWLQILGRVLEAPHLSMSGFLFPRSDVVVVIGQATQKDGVSELGFEDNGVVRNSTAKSNIVKFTFPRSEFISNQRRGRALSQPSATTRGIVQQEWTMLGTNCRVFNARATFGIRGTVGSILSTPENHCEGARLTLFLIWRIGNTSTTQRRECIIMSISTWPGRS